jgi:hypothetical protein
MSRLVSTRLFLVYLLMITNLLSSFKHLIHSLSSLLVGRPATETKFMQYLEPEKSGRL